jgi:EAL domain-containing protein (putative c-di-GMP-specific phosphodiesterase class I)
MNAPQNKAFNLPWNQYEQYWINVGTGGADLPVPFIQLLKVAGMQVFSSTMAVQTGRDWKKRWDIIYGQLMKADLLDKVKVAVTPGEAAPDVATLDWRSPVAMQHIAESLWLGDALLEDRILCYLQPVVSTRDKVFGYESFARAAAKDGTIIGGDKIMLASRALNIEYMIDRHLHVQAITTFVCSDFNGFLFVNLSPGFIHRPAVYLEGLSETAKSFGMIAKHIVLDFTRSEKPKDVAHLKSICDYGKSRGYSIALDDIETLDGARRLVTEIRPDFVKIDRKLASLVGDQAKREIISNIVDLVHANGGIVIAEGVETEESYQGLRGLSVDLFQGFYFSPPVPVETVIARGTGTTGA